MGLNIILSKNNDPKPPSGNPNPKNFAIVRMLEYTPCLLAEVNYPDARNYEGNKVMLFDGLSAQELVLLIKLDPHFDPKSKLIARFAPTSLGWELGRKTAQLLAAARKLS